MFVVVLSAVVVCLSVLLLLFVRFVLRVSFDAAKSVHVAAAVLCQREL